MAKDIFNHPRLKQHTLRESSEHKAARHHRTKIKVDGAHMFRKECEPEERWKPRIKADTLKENHLGKEVQVIAGPRSQTGTLVGRVLNKLLIEFPNGKTRMVADHMCRFIEDEVTP